MKLSAVMFVFAGACIGAAVAYAELGLKAREVERAARIDSEIADLVDTAKKE